MKKIKNHRMRLAPPLIPLIAVMIALIDNAIPMLGIGNSMITEFIKGILLLMAILLNVILQRIANKQDLARRNI